MQRRERLHLLQQADESPASLCHPTVRIHAHRLATAAAAAGVAREDQLLRKQVSNRRCRDVGAVNRRAVLQRDSAFAKGLAKWCPRDRRSKG
eukprot:1185341-Prorocentrum_minimum.AAC.6